jgi:CRP/FNR family cyclic AMP-dependent transcriptional regulator
LPLDKLSTTLIYMEARPYESFKVLVTNEERAELEEIGQVIHRSAGQLFFKEGEPGDSALLIRKGHVKVVSGTPARLIEYRGPGAIVGEFGVISGEPRMASIIAFDEVEALHLPGAAWLRFLRDHSRACLALVVEARGMVTRATQRKIESELAIEQQLAKKLVEMAEIGLGEAAGDGVVIFRRVSQQDVASQLGAKKLDSVKAVIKRLKGADIISTGRQLITILQLDVLREIADGNRTVS